MTRSDANPPELLDTSVMARYLIGDHPEMERRAVALIDSDRPLHISVVALAEIGFLLQRHYGIARPAIVGSLIDLLMRQNIEAHEVPTEVAIHALRMCAPSGRVSFADAMLWATARAGSAAVWTFDRAFPTDGITRREP